MWRKTIAMWLVMLCLCGNVLCGAVTVTAAQPVTVQWQAEDGIRPPKPFSVSLMLSAQEDIGAFQGTVTYDGSKLSVVSVTFRDKQTADSSQYYDENGRLRFVFSGAGSLRRQRTVDIRFRPLTDTVPDTYHFAVTQAEVCDADAVWLTVVSYPELTLTVEETSVAVSQNETVIPPHRAAESAVGSDKTAARQNSTNSRAVSSSGQADASGDKQRVSHVQETSSVEEVPRTDSETAQVPADHTVIIREKASGGDSLLTIGIVLSLAGVVMIVGVLLFLAFRLGVRQARKKND